ncbi:MAG: hypothetical protein CK528_08945 [Alcaligenaceae bacterium]|nr:MAG: hypothetical protein CK528_08945 [Alcaligenaceae bacterium]
MTHAKTLQQHPDAPGELLIWTSVDPAYELDFNQWYDQEHMQERAAIQGFRWSRRYHSDTCARPYLALYQTDTLHVFTSEPYRLAFTKQTQWSERNFTHMRDTSRRVNAVTPLAGVGTGAAVALVCLQTLEQAQAAIELAQALIGAMDGVLAVRALCPDPVLSTPLPSEDVTTRKLEPFLVIETTSLLSAEAAKKWMADQLACPTERSHCFRLLWDLQSSELER